MKTFTNPLIKAIVVICLCFFSFNNLYSQVRVPFTQRTAADTPGQTVYSIKGDFTLIGNTNLTLQNYGTNTTNSNNTMVAVDVDGDTSTTNSSSANLNFSTENGAIEECSKVIYAGLYWTGRTSNSNVTLAKRSVKFKHANQTTYEDVVADVNNIYFPGDNNMYAAYAEVTEIVKANGTGQYFTGNVEISTGNGGSTGYYGGWAMVVVYENDLMEWRDVTVFDGYAYLVGSQTTSNTLDVTGFNAIQNGPVNVKLGVIAGEGDRGISGDYLEIWEDKDDDGVIDTSLIPLLDEWTPLSHSGNSTGNFFNSSIQTGGNTRNPNLVNNTGLDISMFYINNTNNDIIDNGATNTSFRYGSTQDTYIIFNIAMAIDAFVPSIDGQISINNIDGDTSVVEPYTINPGETAQFDIDIHNNGNEALENFLIQIPIPDTGIFVPGSIQYTVNAPANTTTAPYYDAAFGTNGGIIWQFGDLPEATNLSDVLASLSFEVEASTNCQAFNPPNCSPIISLSSALMTGTGAVSQSPFFIKFNSGYQQAPCIAYPISEPIVISVIPSLEIDSAASNLTVECDGSGNTTAVNNWLTTAGNATVVGDCVITWTNNFTGLSENECGAAGSTTVTFTGTDSCGNTTTTSALLTIEDTTPPDLSNCSVTDEILECNGTDNETIADNWNAANLLALQTCPVDDCNTSPTYTVVSNYNFDNLISTCGAGGTIEVIYTGSDDCGNEASITAILTLNDSIGPDLSNCSVADEILECNGTDNQTIANNWNAANILALQTCPVDDCNATATYTVVSNYNFANLVSTCGAGGTIEVIYTGSDDCGNESSITATLTLNDSIGPDLSNCSVTDEILECNGTDNQTIANNWNAANILALQTCPVDDCNATATYTVVSNYNFANLVSTCGAGGTIEVIYTGSDDCGNESSITATLTLNDSIGPDLTSCTVADETIECDGTNNQSLADAWNAANLLALQSCGTDACDTDAVFDVSSDYAFTNLTSTCGAGGTITVTYTVADDCDNETILVAVLTLNDSIGPDLTACTVEDETIECDGTNNETLANDWNAANILALQSCGTDSCDTDAVFDVTSDYAFANLASTCGAGGTILVTYIVSDDCDNETILTATLTLNDSIGPDLTSCTVVDETIECDGTNNETLANDWNAANILALQSCGTDSCDTDAVFDVTSDYAFANLASTCGLGGTITVTYIVADDCDNETTLVAILTLNDSIGPDLSVCTDVTDTSVDCTADQNETIADAWHAANLLALESCGSDSCDADGAFEVTSDYDFNNLNVVCGPCGSLPVTYTVADDCGNTSEITVTLNFGDATGPDLTACNVVDETIECDGANNETLADTWNADNIAELQACADDINVTITSDYVFTNLATTCGAGGTIQVTYTATDDCLNTSSVIATLTLNDSIGPDLTACTVEDETIECDGTNNETLANDWNAANILALQSCGTDSCDTDAVFDVTSDYAFANLAATCGAGGTILVTYIVSDDCDNETILTATLTLNDSIGPNLSACTVVDETIECDGTNNETIANDWNAANILALQSCGTDSCDTDAVFDVTSDYTFTNLTSTCGAGGTITVTYIVSDDCDNETTLTAILTLNDSIGPDLSVCTDVTDTSVDCTADQNETIADAWHAANLLALESCGSDSCDADGVFEVTSDYDFNNLNVVCGPCGSLPVTYTVADDCGNTSEITVTLNFGDATGPDLTACNVVDETIECDGANNETLADTWNADNIAELQACADDINVTITSDYVFTNLATTCGAGGTIQVTYTATDDCLNTSSVTATLTLNDSIGPDLTACAVVDETIECDGTNNETIANDWNAANILALQSCGTDSCDTDAVFDVTSDYVFTNLTSTCGAGGTILVTYTVADDCGNETILTATLTLEDSIGPDLTACTVVDETIECDGTNNETLANDWNAANILALQSCGTDSCDTDAVFDVTSDYAFANLASTCGLGGTITVTYIVADDCDNETTLVAILTLNDSIGPDLSVCTDVTDTSVDCTADQNETIADAWHAANILALQSCGDDACDADGAFEVTSDYDFNNLNVVCGPCGSLPVTYTVADDCGNTSEITVILNFGDATGPDLTACNVVDETIECDGANNETLADTWNADNIAELQACADDINVTITSDYVFTNLATTCGAGGTIQVTYTATDDCLNTSSVTATLTLNDSIGPDLTACTVVDETIECDGTNNETLANDWNAANILALQSCGTDTCDTDAVFDVTSDYAFANLAATCGAGGTILVTYIVSDDCDNETILTATLTINDSIGPNLSACTVVDETIECDGTNNETLANDWNAANILALQSCGTDSCDTDAVFDVTSDYAFANLASTCGLGGTITVTYIVADDCDNETTLVAILTLNDSIGPDLSVCTDVTDTSVDCTADQNETIADAWHAANILALQSCGDDACDADGAFEVTSDYDFNNLNVVCGPCGSLPVTYTVADDCGNTSEITVTLNFGDATGPDLTACNVVDETIECDGANNETLADTWNADNIAELQACADDINVTITSDYVFTNLATTCGAGGTIQVTYTATDDCLNTSSVTATLTLNDSIGPDLTACTVVDETIECDGTNNETLANDWNAANILALQSCGTDTCDTDAVFDVTSDYAFANLAATCGAGGTILVTYIVSDDCDNETILTATLTINDSIGPNLSACTVVDETIECDGTNNETLANDWNAANILALQSCGTDSCDTDAVFDVTSDYAFANLASTCGLGGTITVTYIVADDCDNETTLVAILTLNDSIGPDLSVCTDVTDTSVDCTADQNETIADAWHAANILALQSCGDDACDADGAFEVTSDYDFNNLNVVCGPCGSLPVTYTVADDCGNTSEITVTLNFGDATGPDLTACNVVDETIECDGANNETLADTWNADNIAELQACADDINVTITSDYLFTNLVSTCGAGGTITVTYTATDDCLNTSSVTATLTLNDSIGPDLTACAVVDETIECDGTNNETLANDWNAANILALQSCGTDSCDTDAVFDVTSDYAFANLAATCGAGGTITVTYTVADDCGNETILTATLTLEDSIGPDLTSCTVEDETIECDGTNNETLANDWNAANILALQSCGTDSCDTDAVFDVTSDYAFANLASTCGLGGTITVTYIVADDCDNETTLVAILTLNDSIGPDLSVCTDVTDTSVDCTADQNETIADAWHAANLLALESCGTDSCDADGAFEVTSDYDFNNLNVVCGPCGSLPVTYTVADDCGNTSEITVTLNFGDATGPDLTACNVVDETIECDGANNETLADTWNADNIAELQACADDINVTITSDYVFTNLATTCGAGGTIQVTYTATDDCLNTSSVTATLTLNDSIGPDLTACTVEDETIECDGTNNETLANDWNAANILALQSCGTDSCDTDAVFDVTSDYAFANLASTCGAGGTILVTYIVSDDCDNETILTATLTLNDSIGPDLTACTVVDETIECDGTNNETLANDWNAANILALQSCGTDSCDTDAVFDVTSDYAFANLASTCGLGGTITVTYIVADDCDNETTLVAILTLNDSIGPDLSVCTDVTDTSVDCTADQNETIADAWHAANLLALESCGTDSCDADGAFEVTSDYDFNNLNVVCGPCGSLPVTYTVADDCGNTSEITVTLNFGDATGPDLTACNVVDETIECDGANNETLADTWNADNIAELQACADDINVTITSDYVFTNLATTCGAGGTIQVTYTATDDCLNTSSVTATLTLNDSIGPDLTACTVEDETIECDGTNNETLANDWNAANILALQSCGTDSCDTDAVFDVTSDYAFANLASTCGAGGTILVTYIVSDDCDNETILTATLTLNDSIGPDLTACTVVDETIECDGTNNETLANDWNAANILALQSCGTDSCDTDAVFDVTSDYAFANLASTCGLGGTITVTYIVADDCDNETTFVAILTLNDSIGPDLSICTDVTDTSVDCTADQNETIADAWHAANILALQSCGDDACDADGAFEVTSDYDFNNLNVVCGPCGSLPVTYTVADDCGNTSEITVTLNFGDATGPDLTACNVVDETIECDGANNETLADTWNADNIAELQACADDINVTITSDYVFTNLATTCGAGGTILVTYTATDDCLNTSSVTATLTLNDSIGPDLTACTVEDETIECDGTNNETLANDWNAANLLALQSCGTDSCDTDAVFDVTSDYAFANLASTCGAGGTILVTYIVSDDCDNETILTATLTLNDSIGPDLTSCTVVDETIECDGTNNETLANDWNAANILALQSCGTDSCDTDAVFDVTSDYAFANLASTCGLGGTITVTYIVADDCDNETTLVAILTLNDSIGPDLSVCTDVTDTSVDCTADQNETIADAWHAANLLALESCGSDSCDADGAFEVTSDYDFNNLNVVCGPCGSLPVTYTVADDCGNTSEITVTLNFGDATGPDLTACNVVDETIECDGANNETLADTWNADNIAELQACADDINVTITSDYVFTNLATTCGAGGTILVTYTATDDCLNTSSVTATLTLNDSIGPDLTACTVEDETIECDGTNNETLANDWNAANLLALQSCGTDSCDTDAVFDVTSDYAFANLASTCGAGGTILVTYIVSDDCDNETILTATLTLNDSIGPDLTSCTVVDETIECDGTNNETLANDWNAANILALQSCGTDSCDTDAVFDVTSDYAFANLASTCGLGGTITVTYIVADDCDNETTLVAILTLNDSIGPDLSVCTDVTDTSVDCTADQNETIADAWHAANLLALESCGSDSCDADGAFEVTSDYDFNNLNVVCGPCGSLPVTYTVADDCGNTSEITVTLNFGDATGPDLTACNVVDETIECDGANNETLADTWNADNIAELQACADDINVTITSDYVFTNLATTCGAGGTILVTYTATDDCLNTSSVTATLTLNDSIGPDLTACTVEDETIECDGTNNETLANDWNAANILALQSCGTDSCDTDAVFDVTSDYVFTNLASTCGAGGTILVTYTVADDCGNETILTATLTLEDSIGPDLTACTVVDETIECDGTNNETLANDWNAANILALQSCGTDSCDTDAVFDVTSDYVFTNLASTCGAGGTILVTYTVADDCGNETILTATLTLEDSIGPDLTACTVVDETIECDGTNNETLANDWNAANILALQSCGTDSCDTDAVFDVTSDYAFANLASTCGAGGTILVTYTVADDCGNETILTATLTIEDSIGPDLTSCTVVDETIECDGTNNETLANDWNAANILALQSCGTDSCDTDAVFDVTSDYVFTNLTSTCGAGGTILVTYTVADDCGNETILTATLTLEDSIGPDLTACTVVDETIECDGTNNETLANDWNAANILALQSCGTDSCDTDAVFDVTSDYVFTNLTSTCGAGGTILVTYTVADDCDNETILTATLTLEDSIGPDLTSCTVVDETIECNGTDNETIANDWNAANLLALQSCGTDSCDTDAVFDVTSDYAFANLASTCGAGGTILVTYTVADDCGNETILTATLTIEDSIGPDLTACTVVDETIECDGTNNETLANDWNAANILALQSCGTDSCDTDAVFDVTSDYDFTNLVAACGLTGSIEVTYVVKDDCDNATILTATLTIVDNTAPNATNCVTDQTLDCDGENNEAIADQWNADNIAALEACVTDGCDLDFTGQITSDYNFADLSSAPGLGGMLDVQYIITDDCGNETEVYAMLTLQNNSVSATDVTLCVTEETEAQVYDLFDLLSGYYDDSGTWEVISGDAIIIDGHYFDPLSITLTGENVGVDIEFSYTENNSACPTYVEASIEIHNRCFVLNCGEDDVEISNAVTPNGDQYNEFFEVSGVELCNYVIDVKIFNRWGALIYESHDYQNNWAGTAHNNSVGGSNTVPDGTYYYIVTLKESGIDPINGYIYVGTK